MAHDRNPMLTVYADKSAVRKYVSDKVGDRYLAKLLKSTTDPTTLSKESLPSEFALKANHGSGASIIAWESADKNHKLSRIEGSDWRKHLIHPDQLDWQIAQNLMHQWLNQNYYWDIGRQPEWAYKNIEPCIVVEELLLDGNNKFLKISNFLCSMASAS